MVKKTFLEVLPLFFTDADTAPRLARCARDIIELLEKRALERKETRLLLAPS